MELKQRSSSQTNVLMATQPMIQPVREALKGNVSASYVNLLFDWMEQYHPEVALEMPFSRPAPGELNRVKIADWQAMLEWAVLRLENPDLPLVLAKEVRLSNTGLLGYVASCCATLGEAFARLQQFENLIYAVNELNVEVNETVVILRWGVEQGRPGHWVDSAAIGVLLGFTRSLVSQVLNPKYVAFVNPSPPNVKQFEAFFGCPVHFDQAHTEIAFDSLVLALPLKAPDTVMRAILDQQAELLLQQVEAGTEPIPGIRRALQDCITGGQPYIEALAARLHVSVRTLQRRFQDSGTNFRKLLEEVRLEVAKNCLAAHEMSLVDLANFLGYNDQSAFSHAFKRATGVSPLQYRKRNGKVHFKSKA